LLGSGEFGDATVIADLEAGIGTLMRLGERQVDAVLVVVEPTPKSVEVGMRAVDLARERSVTRVIVVANRLRDDADLQAVKDVLGDREMIVIPEDPVIARADREGVAPIDIDPTSPGVAAIVKLAERLAGAPVAA
jgi:CO dehydrogenase nickel-insertion accessory protein CooC1